MFNYQINKVSSTIPEHLKIAEETVRKQSSKSVMVVSSSTSYKSYEEKVDRKETISTHGEVSKDGKQGVAIPTVAEKRTTSEGRCFQCRGTDHCKHNCKAFLKSQK